MKGQEGYLPGMMIREIKTGLLLTETH